MSTSVCTTNAERAPIPLTLIGASYVQQHLQHVPDGGEHPRIRPVGVLQSEQVGHLLIDIDPGGVAETLLQGIEHHVLACLQVLGGACGLALIADDLAYE